jgi:hypothetical protein
MLDVKIPLIWVLLILAGMVLIYSFRAWIFAVICHRTGRWIAIAAVAAAAVVIFMAVPRYISEPSFDPSLSGAHWRDRAQVSPGYNLYSGKLIDMDGRVVKQWDQLYLNVIDTNGDYYAQKSYEYPLWGRYRWDGTPVWEKNFNIHHEICLTPKGTVITFTKEVHLYNGRMVEFDVILEFDKDGNEIGRFSLWEHLEEFQKHHRKLELDQPPNFILPVDHYKSTSVWGGNYDYYHLNSLSIIPRNFKQGVHPAFEPGNWLISFRHGNMTFILDQETKKILWRAIDTQIGEPGLDGQHTPFMLENGNILMFDNGRDLKKSRVIEIDPIEMRVVWEFTQPGFYSLSQGNVQALPNKNILITESESGHVFEVTRDKEVVWEYYTPDRRDPHNSDDPKRYGQRQQIYRMTRYSKEMIDKFLLTDLSRPVSRGDK